jgi:transglutaminase-like putative cysteine protease
MHIRIGFEITLHCQEKTPLLLALSPHPEEGHRIVGSSFIFTDPETPLEGFIDEFGNWRNRLVAAPGALMLRSECIVEDNGLADEVDTNACQHPVETLPLATLPFLSASRYCESDALSEEAWRLFGNTPMGWPRIQAICDFVHRHLSFGYAAARPTKTALDAFREGRGVCRDFAHLAIAFCRAVNIPARYVSGYLGDIGVPPAGPGDFCAWFEVYLEGRWRTFDARYNVPRIGRVVMVRGRDAADVPMVTSFGNIDIAAFGVWCDEVTAPQHRAAFPNFLPQSAPARDLVTAAE